MATSGTTNFNLDLAQVVEEAFERAGGEMKSGYDLRTARRSLNLMFADWANRGLNMWTFEQGTIALGAGIPTYALPEDTIDLIEVTYRESDGLQQRDTPLMRMSVSSYAGIPLKTQAGRPAQVFIERAGAPRVTLWPVPDKLATLVYWRLRRIQDAGHGSNTQDVPFRFLPAMVAGLAYHLALKVPGGMARLDVLKMQYDEAWAAASDEDRERASVHLLPDLGTI